MESACLAERLQEKGLSIAKNGRAELYILNSCAVTERAVTEGKKLVKSWLKEKPKRIVITGCAAISHKEDFLRLAQEANYPGLILLEQKAKLNPKYYLEDFSWLKEGEALDNLFSEDAEEFLPFLSRFGEKSRAFLKVQDGCSSFCSYCIVPFTRGPSRSLPEEYILKQAQIYIEQGYREIVITGIHVGMWGRDLSPTKSLVNLLAQLEKLIEKSGRKVLLRLTSLEATEFNEEFFKYLEESRYLCPHFHIPLQSGSNRILKLMNRHYTKELYLKTLFRLQERFPLATFGADVIVGFPEEREEDFLETLNTVWESPLNWLHLFPYSERPGTVAAKLPHKVPEKIKKHRVNKLRRLIAQKREAFLQRLLGKEFLAIVEKVEPEISFLTENYVEGIALKPDHLNLSQGDLVRVRLKEVKKGKGIGEILGKIP